MYLRCDAVVEDMNFQYCHHLYHREVDIDVCLVLLANVIVSLEFMKT